MYASIVSDILRDQQEHRRGSDPEEETGWQEEAAAVDRLTFFLRPFEADTRSQGRMHLHFDKNSM